MKWKLAALCIALSLVCTACGAEKNQTPEKEKQETEQNKEEEPIEGTIPTITYQDYSKEMTQEDTGIPLLQVKENFPVIALKGNEEAQERMNRVFEQQRVKNQSQIESSVQAAEDALETIAQAAEDALESREAEERWEWEPCSYEYIYETKYASAKLLSIKAVHTDSTRNTETYQDGTACSYTFYVPEGKLLTLSEIFSDVKGAKEITEQYIRDKVTGEEYGEYLMDDYESYISDILTEDVFYLEEQGLVVICNPYLLTDYESGIIEIRIPYKALEGVMNETYLP